MWKICSHAEISTSDVRTNNYYIADYYFSGRGGADTHSKSFRFSTKNS